MDKRTKTFLDRCRPAEIDQSVIDELFKAMKEAAEENTKRALENPYYLKWRFSR